jgi:L-alanine-DL-glutamate epimerase-like enolase superfamily enzyme
MNLVIRAMHQSFPLAQVFRISRGAKTSAEVVVVLVSDGEFIGWGESVPYARYGETIESVIAQINALAQGGFTVDDHAQLSHTMPAGSARNALDCALWDLRCKQKQKSIYELVGMPQSKGCFTAQTLSIDTPEKMQIEAKKLATAPVIKIKLDAEAVLDKMQAVAEVCPNSKFIVDANEGWDCQLLERILPELEALNVALIEQPLPADNDAGLINIDSPIPLCADESCHTLATLDKLRDRYQAINIKLDKTGGLSEALNLLKGAQERDMTIMVGCMVGSSLAMAPAYVLSHFAQFVDLDGPLLVAKDRDNGFDFNNGTMTLPSTPLWGDASLANQGYLQSLWKGAPFTL